MRFVSNYRSRLINIESKEESSSPVKLEIFSSYHGTIPTNPAVDRLRYFKFFKRPISAGIGRAVELLKMTSTQTAINYMYKIFLGYINFF